MLEEICARHGGFLQALRLDPAKPCSEGGMWPSKQAEQAEQSGQGRHRAKIPRRVEPGASRPSGFAAGPPLRGKNRPEPGAAHKVPSLTTTWPRRRTVTGQPLSVRPAKGV